MNENSDDLELATCARRARRWTIGLACLLTLNFSLVALALGGYGVRPSPLAAAMAPAHGIAPAAPAAALPTTPPAAPTISTTQREPASDEPLLMAKVLPPVDPIPPQPMEPQPELPPSVPTVPPAPPTSAEPPPVVEPAPALAPAPAPQAVIAPPKNELPEVAIDSLLVVNPGDIGGAVHFVVDGTVHSLAPGEFCELPGRRQRRVEFHRGGEFGYAQHDLESGPHTFGLGESGWTLQPLASAAARKLLNSCRLKANP